MSNSNKYSISQNNENNENKIIVKKNRTLQYYKFIFYSIKAEIKINDFLYLIRTSNSIEMITWFISVVIYANIYTNPYNYYKYGFIWIHLFHILRSINGSYIGYKLPRSFHLIDNLKILNKEKLTKMIFNDIIRDVVFNNIIIPIKNIKKFIMLYIFLTLINLIIDIIEFFILLIQVRNANINESKIILISYFIIDLIYIFIDNAYFIWFLKLKYIFPRKYVRPIYDLFNGFIDKAMITFKIKKAKTNVITENKIQQNKILPYKTSSAENNGGVNILEEIIRESFGYSNNKDKDNSNKLPK